MIYNYDDLKQNYNKVKEIYKTTTDVKEKIVENIFIIDHIKHDSGSDKYIYLDWIKFLE